MPRQASSWAHAEDSAIGSSAAHNQAPSALVS